LHLEQIINKKLFEGYLVNDWNELFYVGAFRKEKNGPIYWDALSKDATLFKKKKKWITRTEELCIFISMSKNDTLKWSDGKCETKASYICERIKTYFPALLQQPPEATTRTTTTTLKR